MGTGGGVQQGVAGQGLFRGEGNLQGRVGDALVDVATEQPLRLDLEIEVDAVDAFEMGLFGRGRVTVLIGAGVDGEPAQENGRPLLLLGLAEQELKGALCSDR